MKTYEQFRDETMKLPRFTQMTYQELENAAAKEYAKQWVDPVLQRVIYA